MPRDRKTPKAARSTESLTRSNRPKAEARYLDDRGSRIHPVFSFELADRNETAEWGWHLVDESNASRLVEMLRTWGSSTWNEIRAQTIDTHKRHHWQDIGSLYAAACERLQQLELEDFCDGQIFRFRDGPTKRLWGFEREGVFYALWWDPNHRVYPTEPN